MDLCLAAVWRPGLRVSKRWWEHENLDLEGMWGTVQLVEAERDGRSGREKKWREILNTKARDTVPVNTRGKEPNSPLSSAMGSERR